MAGAASDHVIDASSLPACPAALEPVEIVAETIEVKVGYLQTVKAFSLQARPSTPAKVTVLLLHGRPFTSQYWVKSKTLPLLASWGYHAIAIDLPEFGRSRDYTLGKATFQDYMSALVETLPCPLVTVIPNVNDCNVFAQMFSWNSHRDLKRKRAAIPVPHSAAVRTGLLGGRDQRSQMPYLVVFGSKEWDSGFCKYSELEVLPAPTKDLSLPGLVVNEAYPYSNEGYLFNNVLHHFLSTLDYGPVEEAKHRRVGAHFFRNVFGVVACAAVCFYFELPLWQTIAAGLVVLFLCRN